MSPSRGRGVVQPAVGLETRFGLNASAKNACADCFREADLPLLIEVAENPVLGELHYRHVITENWQMSVLMFGVLVAAALTAIIIPVGLRYGSPAMLKNLSLIKTCLLVLAAACSGLLSLMCLAAAAWGMNTRLPWGLGILMYLIPALSLPAFIVLKFGSVRTLSSVLWLMALASSLAFILATKQIAWLLACAQSPIPPNA
jgi:hypothetical protein